jgi:hypothetical protein
VISERPLFLEGEHFRRNRKAGSKWRFTTLKTIRIKIDFPIGETISFRDRNGIEWVRLEPTACGKTKKTIREGYSWDGATMVPDCGLYLETLNHDSDYQFLRTEHFPFSRRECDDAFLDLMKLARFPLAIVYWRGVRTFGGAFRGQNGEWSKIPTTHAV